MATELLQLAAQVAAVPVAAGILANGLEEMGIDAQYFARGLHRRQRRAISAEELAAAPPRRIAIMVPAWREADVIKAMLEHNRGSIDYDAALYDFFCGTYQNDPDTQSRIDAVAEVHPNVHKVIVPNDGPTSKADCLNWIYQGVVLEEQRRGQRFDILLMHDAEDVIHPLALRLYSLLIPAHDFVQTPVFSLPLRHRSLVAATYIDEFAEHHLKDMLVREAIGGLVPSAGVGSAFARDAFEEIALASQQQPFRVDSLTEDYDVGLKFRLAGKRVHFACRSLQRTRTVRRRLIGGTRRVVDEEIIATREYFPSGFGASVRQRARWITGIALQTWRQVGWKGSAAVRYCLWRDRKVVATNSLILGAYLLLAFLTVHSALSPSGFAGVVPPRSLLWWLMTLNLLVLVWRTAMKMTFVGKLYGAGHALLSVPRMVVGNLIGLAATGRAVRQFAHHLWTGAPLRWSKTAHAFPSADVLAAQQRRLGEFLIERGQLAPADVETALRLQAGTDMPLGEVIAASGMMTSRAVIEALGAKLALPCADPRPDQVPIELLRRLPEADALALEAMPIAIAGDGRAVIAMARRPNADDVRRLAGTLRGPVLIGLADREAIRRGRWRAYRRLIEQEREGPRTPLGEALIRRGAIDRAGVTAALDEQIETGERLGELLVRRGAVTAAQVADAIGAPHLYRSVTPGDIDVAALRRIGYGLAHFYQLAPIRAWPGLQLASPFPIHASVVEEVARRTGSAEVETILAPSLEVCVSLALVSRDAWPGGVALGIPGFDGEEVAALLVEPDLAGGAAEVARIASEHGVSPVDHLESTGRIDAVRAAGLRARALGLPVEPARPETPALGFVPPELVARHDIRLCADGGGLVLAASRPAPLLAHQVAELYIVRAVAWRVLAAPVDPAVSPFTRESTKATRSA
jgi:bacteriophage N4 adsorption protein B